MDKCNKIIFALLINIFCLYAMEESWNLVNDSGAARQEDSSPDFDKLSKCLQEFVATYQLTRQEETILGYSLKPILLVESDTKVVKTWPTLHISGNSAQCEESTHKNSFKMAGDYLRFNLPDVSTQQKISGKENPQIGQAAEIIPTIKLLYDLLKIKGMNRIDIQADGAGAVLFINSLASLYYPSKKIESVLLKLGIDFQEQLKIIGKIKAGCHFLCWPLREVPVRAQNIIHTQSNTMHEDAWHIPLVGNIFNYFLTNIEPKESIALSDTTSYSSYEETVEKSLNFLRYNKDFTFLMITQKGDEVVGNEGEIEYFLKLPALSENKYWKPGKFGKHKQLDYEQICVINAYRKKYGSSYYNEPIGLKKGENILPTIQPEGENINEWLVSFYKKVS